MFGKFQIDAKQILYGIVQGAVAEAANGNSTTASLSFRRCPQFGIDGLDDAQYGIGRRPGLFFGRHVPEGQDFGHIPPDDRVFGMGEVPAQRVEPEVSLLFLFTVAFGAMLLNKGSNQRIEIPFGSQRCPPHQEDQHNHGPKNQLSAPVHNAVMP